MTGRPQQPPAGGGATPSADWLVRANRLALVAHLLPAAIHDVNNALQIIGGGVELLEMSPADPLSVTRAIGSQAERASQVLDRVSSFVRHRGGGPDDQRVDLHALAEEVLALRGRALSRLRIRPEVDGSAAPVRVRRQDVLQILLNLVVNAEQALAGRPSPWLRVAVHPSTDTVRVEVEDNGPGPGSAEAPFDCRMPGDGPVDRLGIGLWVSRELAARLGGSLAYRPRTGEGGGSIFTLTLPASGG